MCASGRELCVFLGGWVKGAQSFGLRVLKKWATRKLWLSGTRLLTSGFLVLFEILDVENCTYIVGEENHRKAAGIPPAMLIKRLSMLSIRLPK